MEKIKVGFAMCGSFCTFKKTLEIMEERGGSRRRVGVWP